MPDTPATPAVQSFDSAWAEFVKAAVADAKEFQKKMKGEKSDISEGQIRSICERHFGGLEFAKLTDEFVAEVKKAL